MAAPLWSKAPFLRILTALIAGITLQWYCNLPLQLLIGCFTVCLLFVLLYSLTGLKLLFRLRLVNGFFINLLMIALGCLLIWQQNVRHHKAWVGNASFPANAITVRLEEPLVEKANSYKALASIVAVASKDSMQFVEGKVLLYFKKDSVRPLLDYGSQLVFTLPLQEIKNNGNPGNFDYKTYSLYQGITHQVFLNTGNYIVLPGRSTNGFQQFLFDTRSWVIATIRKYIKGDKEQGLAEALLIGFKDDLDRDLVEAYSKTGTVHIIAISGLHLGLIYLVLVFFTKRLKRYKSATWLRFFIIVGSLWLFSLLAGAQPSVLRSAVMFTIIAGGEIALRRTNIFNTLALSACVLLCINPFWLWDVGFQLSYTAVLSIVLFFQPVYNWYRPDNKLLDFFWKITAVTIAAQILTMPISIYHFHQMPLLFLLTNLIAVPVSSVILLGEMLLCALAFLPALAQLVGTVLQFFIRFMNGFIEDAAALPFSVWYGLSINLLQMALLLFFATAICYWLMDKRRRYAWIALTSFAVFLLVRGYSFHKAFHQQKLIVYNVPKHTAVDVIDGRDYYFIGDSALLYDDFARNFHLQPSRILHRISLASMDASVRSFNWQGKQVLIVDEIFSFRNDTIKPVIDVVVLSKNPKLYISKLADAFMVKQIVIDGSVSAWKAGLWKKDCDSLQIPCYDVAEKGAFVLNL